MKKVFFLIPLLFFCTSLSVSGSTIPGTSAKTNFEKGEIKKAVLYSSSTDHFRSKQTGDWNDTNTWESSPDNIVWVNSSLVPTSTGDTISIRTGDTVTISSAQVIDEVFIENGGVLIHTGGLLTVTDDVSGDDIIIQSGGIFTLDSAANPPQFFGAPVTIKITAGGKLRVSAGGMTGSGTGVNAVNYIYQHGSILELTVVYSTDGVTYFPNVAADTIPVFRSATNLNIGAAGATTFNGVFEAVNSFNMLGTGQKIFRNGITGSGNIDGSTSGKFIVNGTTAVMGGTGTITLPVTDGMDMGTGTTVTMVSNKSVIGTIVLLSNTFVMLGIYDLNITGAINGGNLTSHIVTNSAGKLVINNVGVFPGASFPIGATTATFNPLIIFNGEGLNYAARVDTGINPAISVPVSAVNRTWVVKPSATPAGTVNVNFFYSTVDGNASFIYAPATVEQGFYTSVWNVINTSLTQFGGPVNFQVTGTVNIFAADTDAPMVIANLGAILANERSVTVDYFNGINENNKHVLNWKVTCIGTASVTMEVERSTDGINFSALNHVFATALRCSQPFDHIADHPAAGVNYYRIKMTDADGKVSYSKIVILMTDVKGILMMNIAPNPVEMGIIDLKINSAKNTKIELMITDMQGRLIHKEEAHLFTGLNAVKIHVAGLSPGTYMLTGNISKGKTEALRLVIQ